MSSQNAFPSRFAGRPAPNPVGQDRPAQPSWASTQPGHAPQQAGWPQQQFQPAGTGGYQAPANTAPAASPNYPQWGEYGDANPAAQQPAGASQQYAPQFEAYTPPSRPAQAPQFPGKGGQWAGAPASGYNANAFAPHAPVQTQGQPSFAERPYQEPELSAVDWHQPNSGNGQFAADPYQQGGGPELGFAQPVGGELDPQYGEEEEEEYEVEEAVPRRRRPFMILAALAGAVLVGGSLAYSFKKMAGGNSNGSPPLIKSEAAPTKTKPADAGGKQFPYADSKIMGRLGDGSASAATSNGDSADEGASRKVSTLIVNRDGSIQAPAATPAAAAATTTGPAGGPVAVPGMTLVDAFGAQKTSTVAGVSPSAAAASPAATRPAFKKVVVVPPPAADDASDDQPAPKKVAAAAAPVKLTKINGTKSSSQAVTGSIAERDDAAAPVAPKPPKKKKIAKAETAGASTAVTDTDASAAPSVTGSHHSTGFVAVLASVPKSNSSRMDALKRFADLQQQYGDALTGKTPDVAEATVGTKGPYHRLIAGPPGSKEEASTVCSKLKTAGYPSCWVMSY